jgi:hypothetical protein
MSKLEDKTVEIMDKAMIGAEKLTEKMAELAVQYGPDVVNAGLSVAQYQATQQLIYGTLMCTASLGVMYAAYWLLGYCKRLNEEKGQHEPREIFSVVSGLYFGLGLVLMAWGGVKLFNIWNWVGIFEPKLWIAHRILEKAL